MRKRYENTCEVIAEDNGEKFVAEIEHFVEHKTLMVSLHQKNYLLRWDGEVYKTPVEQTFYSSNGPLLTTQ